MSIFAKPVVIGNVRGKAKLKKKVSTHSVSKTCQIYDGKKGDEKHWKICGAPATYRVKKEGWNTVSACKHHAMVMRRIGSRIAPIW